MTRSVGREVLCAWESTGEPPVIRVTEKAIVGSPVALGVEVLLHPLDLDRIIAESFDRYVMPVPVPPTRASVQTLLGCDVKHC